MAFHNEVGKIGEDMAVRYLEDKGYQILCRNWKNRGRKELDIVAIDDNELVFVEVKTRSEGSLSSPFDAVDYRKQHRLALAANSFIMMNRISLAPRFDVVGIVGIGADAKVEHIQNAFVPSGTFY